MANILLNETVLHIESSLASVNYAERMFRLADQYRREGNHAAANGALMMAWDIRQNSEWAMDIMADLTREHAGLLSQPDRQRLVTELNASRNNLDRLAGEHVSTEEHWNECYEREAEWYQFCFGVGLAAHLADAIASFAEGYPSSEDNIEILVDNMVKCYQVAKESLDLALNDPPTADASFPQTRQQSMEQALDDFLKLEKLDQQCREMLKAAEQEADNSLGLCHLCGVSVRAEDVCDHARFCVYSVFQKNLDMKEVGSGCAGDSTFMIWVRGNEVRQWMMLAVRSSASLLQLDQFLRSVWLECCGHESHFEIGGACYCSHTHCPGGTRFVSAGMTEPDQRDMMHTVQETISSNKTFRHEYDYTYSTTLNLECAAVLPAPYDYLRELVGPPESLEGYSDDFITIVARNLPPESCFTCGEPARWYYYENPYVEVPREDGGTPSLPPYFCDNCAPGNVALVAMRNSPRYGAPCYHNVHDQPVPPSQHRTIDPT